MKKQVIQGIYKITNTETKQIYVGRSINIYKRWEEHLREAKNPRGSQVHLYRAWRKQRVETFELTIIEEVKERKDLADREQYWYEQLSPDYNMIAPEDDPNRVQMIPVYSKDITTGKVRWYESQREAARQNEISKTAIYNVLRGNRNTAANKNWSLTPEFPEIIDRGNKGLRRKAVRVIDSEGNYKDFESKMDAARFYGDTNSSNLNSAIKNKQRYKRKYTVIEI